MSLIGRVNELAALDRHLATLRSGAGAVVLVRGEAGMGKTAFAHAVTRRAKAVGLPTAWGSCVEGSPPFWPWTQILRDTTLLEPADPSVTRFQRFDAVLPVVRGMVVVLDDVHWADPGSLRLLQHVAAEAADLPLVLLALSRDDLDARDRGTHHVVLGGLASAEIAELASRTAGDLDAVTLRAIEERSGGNPLFVQELSRLGGGPLPRGIREAIGFRLDRLPAAVRDALREASVLGLESTVDLSPAVELGILVADGAELRFGHVLTREVLYAELSLPQRRRLHARAAASGPIESVAYHLRQARSPEALQATLSAAARARGLLAYEQAAAQYRGALDLLPAGEIRILLDLAECEFRAGAVDAAWQCCLDAADLGRAAGDGAAVADAATVLRGVTNSPVTGRIHSLCREALGIVDDSDPARQARVLAQLAITADPFAGPAEPDLGQRALQAAEASGDPDARFLALQARAIELTGVRFVLERLSLGDRAVHLGQSAGRTEYTAWGHLWRLGALGELGRRIPLDAELTRSRVGR